MTMGVLVASAAVPLPAFAADEAEQADLVAADDEAARPGDEIVVNGQREAERPTPTTLSVEPTAAIAAVYDLSPYDIAGLATTTVNDLLRAIPGVQVADLGNGGIPNGVTIRGWGLVSDGTAVRGIVDGYTRNFVSGPNNNGSNDLNIVIPEIVSSVNVIKGPFDTRYSGNFAYAGTAIFTTADSVSNRAAITIGSFGHRRIVATLGNGEGNGNTTYYIAVDGLAEEGRRDNNSQNKINIFGKFTAQLGARDVLKLTGQLYDNVYGQPGYVRTDLVQRGLIRETSATDNEAEGWRRSQTLTLEWQHRDDTFNFDVNGWLEHLKQYRSIERQDIGLVDIYPENAFTDKRWSTGLAFHPWLNFKIGGVEAIVRTGAEIRGDFAETRRYPAFHNQPVPQPTQLNAWTNFFNYSDFHVWNPAIYGELSLKPASWVKITAGVRDDWFNYDATVTYYPSTATGVSPPYNPGPPTGTPVPLKTVNFDTWSDQPTLHGGIAITPGAGFTILGNFGEGIMSQNINASSLWNNPHLQPTKLNTKEVVVIYDNDGLGLHLQGGVYSTLNQGELGNDPATGLPVNLGKSIRKGFDIDGRLRLYDRDGTNVRIGANYNYLYAKLTGGTNSGLLYITGTPPWTASWNLDAATRVGPGEQILRLTIQHYFVGGTYLTNGPVNGTGKPLRNGDYNRLAVKLQYERPEFHGLRLWLASIAYGGDRFGEMATTSVGFFNNTYTVRGTTYRVANAQAKFRAQAGFSLDF